MSESLKSHKEVCGKGILGRGNCVSKGVEAWKYRDVLRLVGGLVGV